MKALKFSKNVVIDVNNVNKYKSNNRGGGFPPVTEQCHTINCPTNTCL